MTRNSSLPWGDPFNPPGEGYMPDGMLIPGHNLPPRRGEDRHGLSAFGRLVKGGALGHTTTFPYDATSLEEQEAPNDMILIEGDDLDACQLVITLGVPKAVPQELSLIQGNIQNATPQESNSAFDIDDFPGSGSPIAWPPFQVRVEFGSGGHKHMAYVDYVNGLQFSVTGSYLRAKAVILQSQANGFKGTSAAYTLAATVAPGWTPRSATNTMYVGKVAQGAESAVYALPPFARRATIYLCDPGAAPNVTAAYLRFWQSPDGVAGGNNVGNAFVSGNMPGPFIVPAGAGYFSIFNQSGPVTSTLFSAVFELGLG